MKRSMAAANFVVFAISTIVLILSIVSAFYGTSYPDIAVGALFLSTYALANFTACIE
jgi:hypothetical protein